jgi:hypothetical protein
MRTFRCKNPMCDKVLFVPMCWSFFVCVCGISWRLDPLRGSWRREA